MAKTADLSESCAIVTGATGGIGACFALELARLGCDIILTDLDESALYHTAGEIRKKVMHRGVKFYVLPLDLTSPDVTDRIERFCLDNDIDPDILINNAGIFSFRPLTHMSPRRIDDFISLHIRSVTLLSRWMADYRSDRGGRILNMSSMSCWMPMPGLTMYAATKSYIRVFSRALHYETKESGVSVTVACPGGIATDLFRLPENLKRLAVRLHILDTPQRFAHKAVKRMLKGRRQYINGWLNRLSILFVGTSPTSVRMMVKHKLLDKGTWR